MVGVCVCVVVVVVVVAVVVVVGGFREAHFGLHKAGLEGSGVVRVCVFALCVCARVRVCVVVVVVVVVVVGLQRSPSWVSPVRAGRG